MNAKPLIQLDNVSLVFNKGTVNELALFDNFNFSLNRGDFVSVVGSNGSGKTTMLNLICGTLPVSGGKIILDETDITKVPEYKRAARIGRVFQAPSKGTCPELTIMENLSLAENKGRAFNLSKGVNDAKRREYKELLSELHMGLEDKLDIKVGVLSGGQRQALALLMATMTPLDLLILDEHTAALDPKSSEIVMELTLKLIERKQLTSLMVTHNLRFAVEYGNRLVMMHQGRSVVDSLGHNKSDYTVDSLLKVFNEISIECGN